MCERGCACGTQFSKGLWSRTATTRVLLGQVAATGVRDLLMDLGALEGKGQGSLPGEGQGSSCPAQQQPLDPDPFAGLRPQGIPCTLALFSPFHAQNSPIPVLQDPVL